MNTEMLQALGNKIKHRREQAGLTPTALAKELNMSRVDLLAAEAGEKDISVLQLIKLLEVFNVNYDTFMSDSPVNFPHVTEHGDIVEIHSITVRT